MDIVGILAVGVLAYAVLRQRPPTILLHTGPLYAARQETGGARVYDAPSPPGEIGFRRRDPDPPPAALDMSVWREFMDGLEG